MFNNATSHNSPRMMRLRLPFLTYLNPRGNVKQAKQDEREAALSSPSSVEGIEMSDMESSTLDEPLLLRQWSMSPISPHFNGGKTEFPILSLTPRDTTQRASSTKPLI